MTNDVFYRALRPVAWRNMQQRWILRRTWSEWPGFSTRLFALLFANMLAACHFFITEGVVIYQCMTEFTPSREGSVRSALLNR